MNFFSHFYREFSANPHENRLVFQGAAPTPAPAPEVLAAPERVEAPAAAPEPRPPSHFDKQRDQVFAQVDKAVAALGDNPKAPALKASLRAQIQADFDALNREYQAALGKLAAGAQQAETTQQFSKKADELIARITERLNPVNIQAELGKIQAPEAPLTADQQAAREPLAGMLARDPEVRAMLQDQLGIANPEDPAGLLANDQVGGIINTVVRTIPPARLARIMAGENIELSGLERAQIAEAAIQNIEGGKRNRGEEGLIARLSTADGQTLEAALGKTGSRAFNELISRAHKVGVSKEKGLVVDGTPVANVNALRAYVPESAQAAFDTLMKKDTSEAERTKAQAALEAALKPENERLAQGQQKINDIQKALGDPKVADKLFGGSVTDTIRAVMALFAALKTAMETGDYDTLSEAFADVTGQPPRLPHEVMAENKIDYGKILAQSKPPPTLDNLLAAYTNPRDDAAFGRLIGKKQAEQAGLLKADPKTHDAVMARLGRYRNELKDPIKELIADKLGVQVGSIEKDTAGITKITVYKGDERYQIELYTQNGKLAATTYLITEQEEPDPDDAAKKVKVWKKAPKAEITAEQTARGVGTAIAEVDFTKLQKALGTESAPAIPPATVAGTEAVPAEGAAQTLEQARDAKIAELTSEQLRALGGKGFAASGADVAKYRATIRDGMSAEQTADARRAFARTLTPEQFGKAMKAANLG